MTKGNLLSERAIGVLAEVAKGNVVRIPLRNGLGVWRCDMYGTVNNTALSLLNKDYIAISPVPMWWTALEIDRADPRLRPRLLHKDGRVELVVLTAAGWAAVRRQHSSAETHRLLGPVPKDGVSA